ncbi:RDD family protein [Halostreptopolyspora alba]|uniref:RDD family protein n=1 Tax=Halostreptopolyspora alba TaxID=2487137 RepID=A0A3N0EBM8_9ACTN|nr:RDD family protein [Nocardiopsaceae bacterium YIM 96095]
MNVPPPPRDEGKGAPFEPDGSWSWEWPSGTDPSSTASPHPGGVGGHPPGVSGGFPVANWGQRVVARLFDWIVVAIPAGVAAMLIGFLWSGAQTLIAGYGSSAVVRNFWLIFAVCCFVAFVAYDSVCVKRWRRTLGKRAMGLEVAPVAGGGRQGPIPVASMVARAAVVNVVFLATWSSGLMVTVWLLFAVFVALWPLWDTPNRQGVHDKLAGTVVIRSA